MGPFHEADIHGIDVSVQRTETVVGDAEPITDLTGTMFPPSHLILILHLGFCVQEIHRQQQCCFCTASPAGRRRRRTARRWRRGPEINPEAYTAWNYRKLALQDNLKELSEPEALRSVVDDELRVVEAALRANPKSYGAWYHRSSQNFTGVPEEDERKYTMDKIYENFSN